MNCVAATHGSYWSYIHMYIHWSLLEFLLKKPILFIIYHWRFLEFLLKNPRLFSSVELVAIISANFAENCWTSSSSSVDF